MSEAGTLDEKDLRRRMDGALSVLKTEFGGLRTGRASANLLDPIVADAYGTPTPVNQLATLASIPSLKARFCAFRFPNSMKSAARKW